MDHVAWGLDVGFIEAVHGVVEAAEGASEVDGAESFELVEVADFDEHEGAVVGGEGVGLPDELDVLAYTNL